jgi:tRNA threonylcarbamoyladenosine biosynthesis protein TsaE
VTEGTPRGITTRSDRETADEGRRLAATLNAGDIVILCGTLGAGKTVFVRGLAEGLGLDPHAVHSPSFAMVTEYRRPEAPLALVHVDLYRIDDPKETEELGLSDFLGGDSVMAVEWGEKLPARLRAGAIEVRIEDAGGDVRVLTIRDPRPAAGPAGSTRPGDASPH